MGEIKHTPGPWQWSEDGSRLLRNNRFSSSTVMVIHDEILRPDKADAHLIAAAPELYEALEYIASMQMDGVPVDSEAANAWCGAFLDAQRFARTALAKANGEAA